MARGQSFGYPQMRWLVPSRGRGEHMRSIKVGQSGLCGGVALAVALSGCNSFDPKPDDQVGGAHLVIPIDDRAAVKSDTPPPPISGGTLSISAHGKPPILAHPA